LNIHNGADKLDPLNTNTLANHVLLRVFP
jgi:hypothetical protein